jgi:regulator of nucleoside diphosphate kinase
MLDLRSIRRWWGSPTSLLKAAYDRRYSYGALPATSARGELARARIVAAGEVDPRTVTMNSSVRLVDEVSGEVQSIELVYPHLADGAAGRISVLAPMGSALLGLSVGQAIDWQVPGGRRLRLKVLDVQRDHRPH